MQSVNTTSSPPNWLDKETRALIKEMIGLLKKRHPDLLLAVILYGSVARHEERPLDDPYPSDVDLLVVLDSDDSRVYYRRGDELFHTLGLAYIRHNDAPREAKVMFTSRTMQEWDPTFIENVKRDGIVLYARGQLPAPLVA
jgi:predicted nucleotidyltransferase